jgi:hypothetical protein
MPEPELHRNTSTFLGSGSRWLAIGVIGLVVGGAIFAIGLAVSNAIEIVGLAIAIVFALGALVGVCLLGAAAVTGWAARQKPFA